MHPGHSLHVVMYHYIRDVENTPFRFLKALPLKAFYEQVSHLSECFEMASLETAFAFLNHDYVPQKDLCLLTFDDGLKEHYTHVLPFLKARRIQGLFFLISSCMDNQQVLPVHMNHFLMAKLGPDNYKHAFQHELARIAGACMDSISIDNNIAARMYPWDSADTARFKYIFNFVLDTSIRDCVTRLLFERYVSCPASFSSTLYCNWEEAIALQHNGMLIGGHSHSHRPLSTLPLHDLKNDLTLCRDLLRKYLTPQSLWPFSYPYGKTESYSGEVVSLLQSLGFHCAFSTEVGYNTTGSDVFSLRRVDTKAIRPQSVTAIQKD